MLRSHLTGTLALAFVATAFAAVPAYAAPDTSDNQINIIQHNPDQLGPGPAMQAANAWGGVDAITFQELCKSQKKELEAAGYRVKWLLQREATSSSCAHGPAIATVHKIAATKSALLLKRGGKGEEHRDFWLLCVDLDGTGVAKTTVCTSHFPLDYNAETVAPTGEQNRIKVANRIAKIVNPWIAAGRRVVLAGDFNDGPKSRPMDRFYKAGGNGEFWEGDQRCGDTTCREMEPTTDTGRTLDYFFASAPGVNKLTGVSKEVLGDDDPGTVDKEGHFVIKGSVTFGPLR